jgi:hypothetical protein
VYYFEERFDEAGVWTHVTRSNSRMAVHFMHSSMGWSPIPVFIKLQSADGLGRKSIRKIISDT